MLNVDGYTVWDRIHATSHSEVYTGARDSDGLRVVLKLYRSSQGTGAGRAEQELGLLQRIESDGVVRAVEVASSGGVPVLVVERLAGYPLSRYAQATQIGVDDFLWIALGVTRALADVHDARVIHKDIKLSNILIDDEHMRVCLIDFGIATEFGRAERAAAPATAEGTMDYIAPEQTGRMGLGVDFRTDLYSLGATLYELLTGEPPFRSKRGLDLICAHIAQQPRLASDVARHVPVALSRIVGKLLEKDPELRYQTARGLAADLEECAKELQVRGEIDEDLELGSADVSDRLRFPSKLYGREGETEALREALRRISQGATEWAFIAGPAGIGKSSLAGVLREPLVRAGGYLAEAKFDADRRDRPYAGVAAAMEGLLSQILAGSAGRVDEWSARIRHELGAVGGVLLDLAPSLGYLVDDLPPVPAVGAREERERLSLAFGRFVRAVAAPAHPLALFFDDLQWADAGSLGLLSALAQSKQAEALLIIGGYRDNEVDANPAALRLIQEVESTGLPTQTLTLRPLRLEDTTAMLADALGRTPEQTEGLARRVGPKGQHNPLLVRRLMFHLWDRDLIRHEHGEGWVWDEKRLTEAEITDDAAAMVAARVDALPDRAQQLIKTASLIGTVFDLEMLVTLSSVDRLDVLQDLMGLVEQGLIAPCREGFKFVHDRIREAAQSRLAEGERAKLHHHAARILLERTPPDGLSAGAFQISDHLIAAAERLDETERGRALEILSLAGTLALSKGAADSAGHYLDVARGLVRESDWETRFETAFGAHLQAAEAALQLQRFQNAEELLVGLEQRDLGPLQRAQVIAKQIVLSSLRSDGRAVDLSLAGLRRFGIRWPREPSYLRTWLEMRRTSFSLRGPLDDQMFPQADATDPSWLAPLIILGAAAAQLSTESYRLACLGTAYALRIYKTRGSPEPPSFILAAYANLCMTALGDLPRAQRFARAAEIWSERQASPMRDARSRLIVTLLIHGSSPPRRRTMKAMEAAAETSRELGDLEYSFFALHNCAALAAACGASLSRVSELLEVQHDRWSNRIMTQAYELLRRECLDWPAEREAILHSLEPLRTDEVYVSEHVIATLCFLGRFELAAEISDRFWPRVRVTGGLGSRLADHVFYRGLAHAALAGPASWRARHGHLRILRSCRRKLRSWARHGPDFVHMSGLLEAEALRLRRPRPALALYDRAAKQALGAGYVHHSALSHERKARLLVVCSRSMEAITAFGSAAELYAQWGATAKVAELEALMSGLGGTTARGSRRRRRSNGADDHEV